MHLYDDQPSGTLAGARQLCRTSPTPERRLLRALREALPHLKWRHQAPVGRYFPDIPCLSERLVIEVDGDTHAATQPHDASRALRESEGGAKRRKGEGDAAQTKGGTA